MNALDSLLGQFGPDTIQRMAAQLGASPQQTQSAIQAALPMLMGAMQRNASTPQGAEALHRAVTRDHQGVDLGGLLGGVGGAGGSGYKYDGPMPTIKRDGWKPSVEAKSQPVQNFGLLAGQGQPNAGLWRFLK